MLIRLPVDIIPKRGKKNEPSSRASSSYPGLGIGDKGRPRDSPQAFAETSVNGWHRVKGERETERRYVGRSWTGSGRSSTMDRRVKTVSSHRWCTKCNERKEEVPLVINEAVAIAIWRTSRPGRKRFEEEESERLERHASNINAPLLIVSEFRSFDALPHPFPTIILPLASFHFRHTFLVFFFFFLFFGSIRPPIYGFNPSVPGIKACKASFFFLILRRARLRGGAF